MNKHLFHICVYNVGLSLLLVVCYNVKLTGTLTLDKYHSTKEMTMFLQNITNTYPNLTSLYNIGNSTMGRPLWVMEITKHSTQELIKPNVKLVANIHGNEVVGRELLLHFIKYLVQNYNREKRVTQLLDYSKVHILPSINPDGFEMAMNSKTNTCEKQGPGRNNQRGLNLNRNFPDYFRTNTLPVQSETTAIKNWLNNIPFVLSASIHGGALVASYPFDNTQEDTGGVAKLSITPDNDVFVFLSKVYSKTHPTMHKGEACPNKPDIKFKDGITNGAAWYPFTGGMQDFNYMEGCMEITLEVSCCKFPEASELPVLWNQNREAMLLYLMQVMRGVHGNVTDKDGKPISGATLIVSDRFSFKSTATGHFWRILLPGEYTLKVSADGYERQSQHFTVPDSTSFTDLNSKEVTFKLDRLSKSTSGTTKLTTAVTTPTITTQKLTTTTQQPMKFDYEWSISESKSGVVNIYLSYATGSFALLIGFLLCI